MSPPSPSAGLLAARGARVFALDLRAPFAAALAREVEERRFFLWIPVAAIGGVALNLAADREPALGGAAALAVGATGLAWLARRRAIWRGFAVALAAFALGFLCMGLRTARVATPMLDRVRIATLGGLVEAVDFREAGARIVLRVSDAGDLAPAPRRARLTARKTPDVAAGDYLTVKARLLPPPRAVLPGGYDFARDAYFAGIGAVGSTLGPLRATPAPALTPRDRLFSALDRMRNRLALRVDTILGGDEGAIASAMVTGKRDYLSQNAKDLIREAGIFHIITISGVQMTLVAGIFFTLSRRLLALSPTLASRAPIKKIAAVVAMIGAVAYDLATGSRVGTERALAMTLIVLGAVVLDRRALTMRNLALAILAVIVIEPEAVTGVSFQLSFAAVAALVAVMESRLDRLGSDERAPPPWPRRAAERLRELLFATFCATSATASFMAYHFHDLSPYVLVGNPLTLAVIELFAVPGALLGTALYPLGLDRPVWLGVGLGVKLILFAARLIAAAPSSTLHVRAFAPWSLPFLALAVASAVIWRTWVFRASAFLFLGVGLAGALSGPRYDLIIPPSGDEVALRDGDGRLALAGRHHNPFADEQWLAADADGRDPVAARASEGCDRYGCVGVLPDGGFLSVVADRMAFEEDCARAAIVVTALTAPKTCAADVYDERRLAQTGAVGLNWDGARWRATPDRGPLYDRPWSPAPTVRERRPAEDEAAAQEP